MPGDNILDEHVKSRRERLREWLAPRAGFILGRWAERLVEWVLPERKKP
jgi:hypothetical protein